MDMTGEIQREGKSEGQTKKEKCIGFLCVMSAVKTKNSRENLKSQVVKCNPALSMNYCVFARLVIT